MTLLKVTHDNGQLAQFDVKYVSNIQIIVDPAVPGETLDTNTVTFNTDASTLVSGRKVKHNL